MTGITLFQLERHMAARRQVTATSADFARSAEGMTTKEIARRLGISTKTAENHRGHVLGKLEMRNTAELVRYALRKGLLD